MKKVRILAAGLLVMVLAAGLTACGSSNGQKDEGKQDETSAKTIQTTLDAADGTYKTEVTLKGGSEEESVQSPATVIVKDGQATAVVIWNSGDYDYMKVGGKKIEPVTTEGGSTFRITVPVFDEPFSVTADTTAGDEPGEKTYSLTFSSAGLQDNAADLEEEYAADKEASEKASQAAEESKADEGDAAKEDEAAQDADAKE